MIDIHAVGKRMASAKRGTKQTCENEACLSRFYDLARVPCACPYCGAVCDVPAIVILNFETLGKPQPRKYNNHAKPQKPVIEVAKADDEKAESETEIAPPGEVLLIEDDDDADTDEPASEEDADEIS